MQSRIPIPAVGLEKSSRAASPCPALPYLTAAARTCALLWLVGGCPALGCRGVGAGVCRQGSETLQRFGAVLRARRTPCSLPLPLVPGARSFSRLSIPMLRSLVTSIRFPPGRQHLPRAGARCGSAVSLLPLFMTALAVHSLWAGQDPIGPGVGSGGRGGGCGRGCPVSGQGDA